MHLKRGESILLEVVHPEYLYPISRFLCRCIQCGRLVQLVMALCPTAKFSCLDCDEANWRAEQLERIADGRCAHCGEVWDRPRTLAIQTKVG